MHGCKKKDQQPVAIKNPRDPRNEETNEVVMMKTQETQRGSGGRSGPPPLLLGLLPGSSPPAEDEPA